MKKILLILSVLLISSCATPKPAKVFVGDHVSVGIVRKQAGEEIGCDMVEFNDYFCIHKDDFSTLLEKCSGE